MLELLQGKMGIKKLGDIIGRPDLVQGVDREDISKEVTLKRRCEVSERTDEKGSCSHLPQSLSLPFFLLSGREDSPHPGPCPLNITVTSEVEKCFINSRQQIMSHKIHLVSSNPIKYICIYIILNIKSTLCIITVNMKFKNLKYKYIKFLYICVYILSSQYKVYFLLQIVVKKISVEMKSHHYLNLLYDNTAFLINVCRKGMMGMWLKLKRDQIIQSL